MKLSLTQRIGENTDWNSRSIEKHQQHTGSTVAADVLASWHDTLPQFVKVMPTDYKRVLQERKQREQAMAQQR